jgi:hypothetical protein
MIVAGGLAVVVATAGIAVAGTTGADLNGAGVVSKVTPSKLSKKKLSKVNVLLGVTNTPDSAGNEDANAASERIAWSKNIKVDLRAAPKCNADLPNGIPVAQATVLCGGANRILGKGTATVHAPGTVPQCDVSPGVDPPCKVADQTVTVFNGGPLGGGALQLHTEGDLGGLSPTVDARIVTASVAEKRQGFGQALNVPNAPVTGTLKITSFNAKITKKSGVAKAKCKPKKFKVKRTVVYTDASAESATKSQKCKVKR